MTMNPNEEDSKVRYGGAEFYVEALRLKLV
jgi:hypothetical protein